MKVSVIIPVYNSEQYLEKCLESVINQTYKDIEIICINDGSEDSSLSILKRYKENDSRIIILDKENEGAYNAREDGFKVSKGEYIVFIDSDDWVDINYIKNMLEVAKQYECDIVRCNCYKDFVNERRKVTVTSPYNEEICVEKAEYIKKVYPYVIDTYYYNSMCCQLIKRDIINFKNNEAKIIMAEDFKFNLELITNSKKIYMLDQYLYYYTNNPTSVSTIINKEMVLKKAKDVLEVYKELLTYRIIWNMDEKNDIKIYERILKEYILQISNGIRIMNYNTFMSYFDNKSVQEVIIKLDKAKVQNNMIKLLLDSPKKTFIYLKYINLNKIRIKTLLKNILKLFRR